eukprot:2801336-Amphidinium_carterae.1
MASHAELTQTCNKLPQRTHVWKRQVKALDMKETLASKPSRCSARINTYPNAKHPDTKSLESQS